MCASFESGLEMVLRGEGPGFAIIGGDEQRLVESTAAWLRRHPATERRNHEEARAIWIMDRLLPLDDPTPFEEFRARRAFEVGIYAWGRRAPELMVQEVDRDACLAPILAAWIDTRPTDEDLLSWYEVCRKRGWDEGLTETASIEEYCARSPDRSQLMSFLDTAPEDGVQAALTYLVGSVAAGEPPEMWAPSLQGPEIQDPDYWRRAGQWSLGLKDHLISTLRDLGEHDLAEVCSGLEKRDATAVLQNVAIEFFIKQHDARHVDRLLQVAGSDTPYNGYSAIRRLAEVLPQDRVDAWSVLLADGSYGTFPMCRFVEWLNPESRDVLIPWFTSVDCQPGPDLNEWAVSAMRGWVSKAPRVEVEWWAERPNLPLWQQLLCDRVLHAPPALSPPPVLHFGQDVEADFRLIDPLSFRGE